MRVHLLNHAAGCAVGGWIQIAFFGNFGKVGNGVGRKRVGKAMGVKIEDHGKTPWGKMKTQIHYSTQTCFVQ
jgi:hypothetical protein